MNATPIEFAAHWRAAELAIEDAALEAGGGYELTVTNRFGKSARVNFTCDAATTQPAPLRTKSAASEPPDPLPDPP